MWFFDDIADWWDKQKHRTEEILTEFVAGTHSWWRIAIAGTVQTAMDLGGGFVDVLRLGEGVKEGGWRGLAQDGLRLLALAGPLAKGTRGVGRFFTRDPGGGICGWVSATQVLRQTGVKHFATLEDLARAAGRTPGPSSMQEMTNLLRQLGADVSPSARFPSMEGIAAIARANPNSVVMFRVGWTMAKREVGHALYAFRDMLGRVRIVDRSGAVVKSLEELATKYPGIGKAVPSAATIVKNATVVTLASGGSMIALEVRAAMLATREQADEKMREIEARHSQRRAGSAKKAPARTKPAGNNGRGSPGTPSTLRRHVVKPGETWRSIASQYISADLVSILAGTLQALSYEHGLTDWQAPVPKPGTTLLIPR